MIYITMRYHSKHYKSKLFILMKKTEKKLVEKSLTHRLKRLKKVQCERYHLGSCEQRKKNHNHLTVRRRLLPKMKRKKNQRRQWIFRAAQCTIASGGCHTNSNALTHKCLSLRRRRKREGERERVRKKANIIIIKVHKRSHHFQRRFRHSVNDAEKSIYKIRQRQQQQPNKDDAIEKRRRTETH